MRLALNTSTIRPQSLLDKVRIAAEAGFDGVELWVNDVYQHVGQGGEVSDVEKLLADTGLQVPCMIAMRAWAEAPALEYPIMLDEARRRLELAARLGCPYLVCSPPREACATQQIVERYRDLLAIGREVGVKPTFEYISFFESTASLPQAWEVVRLADDPDATLIVDAFHSWNTGSTLDDLKQIPGARISHYHIDDANPSIPAGQQTDPDRVMPGEGVIDLAAELRVLQEIGYQGWISLELFHPDLWRADPLHVANEGRERLQRLMAGLS